MAFPSLDELLEEEEPETLEALGRRPPTRSAIPTAPTFPPLEELLADPDEPPLARDPGLLERLGEKVSPIIRRLRAKLSEVTTPALPRPDEETLFAPRRQALAAEAEVPTVAPLGVRGPSPLAPERMSLPQPEPPRPLTVPPLPPRPSMDVLLRGPEIAVSPLTAPEATERLQRAGSIMVPGRTLLESIRQTQPLQAAKAGATESIEGTILRAISPEGAPTQALEDAIEALGQNPTVLEQTIRSLIPISSPAGLAAFLLGRTPAAGRVLASGLARVIGPFAARRAVMAAAQAAGETATAFAAFEGIKDSTEQIAEIREGRRVEGSPSQVLARMGKAAVTGAAMGPTALVPGRLLQLGAEVGVFASVPPLLEGRVPTPQDVLDAGILVGALRLTAKARAALRKPGTERTAEEQADIDRLSALEKRRIVQEALAEADRRIAQREQAGVREFEEPAPILPAPEPRPETPVVGPRGEPVTAEVTEPLSERERLRAFGRTPIGAERPAVSPEERLVTNIREEVERQLSERLAERPDLRAVFQPPAEKRPYEEPPTVLPGRAPEAPSPVVGPGGEPVAAEPGEPLSERERLRAFYRTRLSEERPPYAEPPPRMIGPAEAEMEIGARVEPVAPARGPGAQEPTPQRPPEPEGGRPVWAEEFESVGGQIASDGTVLLYHATTKDSAPQIRQEGVLRRPSDAPDSYGVYLSSSPEVARDYGDGTVVAVRVKASDLHPDDVFPGRRMDFTIPTKAGVYRPVSIEPIERPSPLGPPLVGGPEAPPEPSPSPPRPAPPPARPIPEPPSVTSAIQRFRQEGERGIDWTFSREMTQADRDAFTRWVVATGHPLAQQAMTTEALFDRIVRERATETEGIQPIEGKALPPTAIRPTEQRPLEETPLFGQERAEREAATARAQTPLTLGFEGAQSTRTPLQARLAQTSEIQSRANLRARLETIHQEIASIAGPRRFALGRLFRPKAKGEFQVKPEVITSRVADDVETLAHELGHHLDKYLFGGTRPRGSAFLQSYRGELAPIATKGDPVTEGFAEFLRLYLTDAPTAQRQAPRLFSDFERQMQVDQSELLAELHDWRRRYTQWQTQPAEARIEAMIARPEATRRLPTWDTAQGTAHQLYRIILNEQHPFSRMVADAERQTGQTLPASADPVILGATMRAVTKKGEAFIEDGILEFKTLDVRPNSPSLKSVLEPVAKDWQAWEAYAVARRARFLSDSPVARLRTAGERMLQSLGMDRAELDTYLRDRDRQRPDFQEAFERFQEWNTGLLEYLKDAGTLSPEAMDTLKQLHSEYVPWHRFFEGIPRGAGRGTGTAGADVPSAIKTLRGSGRQVVSPIESAIRQAYVVTNLAERAALGRAAVDLAASLEGGGRWAHKVPTPVRPTTFRLEEIKRVLDYAGVDLPDPLVLEELATVFRPDVTRKGESQVAIWRNGKREVWEVDPDLYLAMTNADRSLRRPIEQMIRATLGWATTIKRLSVTLSPEFWFRNLFRDQQTLMAQAGKPPFVGFVKNIYEALRQGDLYREWERAGGAQATLAGLDFRALEKKRAEVLSGRTKLQNLVTHPWQVLRIASELSEVPTRLGVYVDRMKNPLDVDVTERDRRLRAAYESREGTLDFGRTGAAMHSVRSAVAFLNPALQGLDKLVRTHRDHPMRTAAMGASLMGASLGFRLAIEGDDEKKKVYDRLPQWQRDLFYIAITRGADGTPTVWRLPKAFEWGFLYSTIFERAVLDPIFQSHPEVGRTLLEGAKRTLGFNVFPDAALPLVENWGNWSTFRGRPIVPRALEDLAPEYQYTSGTSEVAKRLGQFLHYPPVKIDHVLRVGQLAYTSLQATDELLRLTGATGPVPPAPTPTLAEIPLIRAFVARYPGTDAEPVQRFYERYQQATEAHDTALRLMKTNPEEARRFAQGRVPDLQFSALATQLAKYFGDLRRAEQVIRDGPQSPDEKRRALDRIALEMIEKSEAFLTWVRMIEREASE